MPPPRSSPALLISSLQHKLQLLPLLLLRRLGRGSCPCCCLAYALPPAPPLFCRLGSWLPALCRRLESSSSPLFTRALPTLPPLCMIILLHRQLHNPCGCAPLRPTPSRPRDAPTLIRQRNTLQPRLVFEGLRAVYHSIAPPAAVYCRMRPPTTPGCTRTASTCSLFRREFAIRRHVRSDAGARNCAVPVRG